MLFDLLSLVLNAVAGFFSMLLLARMSMRFMKISFVGQIGQFVLATTDWAVRPLQRLLPLKGRLDLAPFVAAWLLQTALVLVSVFLRGFIVEATLPLAVAALLAGAVELVRLALYLLMGLVVVAAILSWVNPYSPMAPLINALVRPFLAPLRRILPPVSGIDLSPLLLLLVLQILLYLLDRMRGSMLLAFLA